MALCAGYELGEWRQKELVDEIFRWLPSFVLPWSEQQTTLGDNDAIDLVREAAKRVYETDKYKSRGEYGELILHGVLRQEFGTETAVSKFWFKDASNDTVKGFDVVHISEPTLDGQSVGMHLWLGEAKFYSDLRGAIRDAATSFDDHLGKDYLKTEFALVSSKVDQAAPYAAVLLDLLDKNTPLDEVFETLHLPVLLTYNSAALKAHGSHSEDYIDALKAEAEEAWDLFSSKVQVPNVRIEIILIPLLNKKALVAALHERLKIWQQV